ncbi:TPA: hypothetical protein ACKQDZ_002649 [Serratia rubidaea]
MAGIIVENNSLSGDKAREAVKQAAESLKNQVWDINNRGVYRGADGNLYALDTQYGRFEAVSPKGKHLGEVDFSMQKIPDSIDKSGDHYLTVN